MALLEDFVEWFGPIGYRIYWISSMLLNVRSPFTWALAIYGASQLYEWIASNTKLIAKKDRVDKMSCKDTKKYFRSCLRANQMYDGKLAKRGSRIIKLERELKLCKEGK